MTIGHIFYVIAAIVLFWEELGQGSSQILNCGGCSALRSASC